MRREQDMEKQPSQSGGFPGRIEPKWSSVACCPLYLAITILPGGLYCNPRWSITIRKLQVCVLRRDDSSCRGTLPLLVHTVLQSTGLKLR